MSLTREWYVGTVLLIIIGLVIVAVAQVRIMRYPRTDVFVTPGPGDPKWMPLHYYIYEGPVSYLYLQMIGVAVLSAGITILVYSRLT